MLKNIISIYFNQLLFSHLQEKIKLKVLKYNKSLQNSINISLPNYKLFTKKFIIYETKEKTKGKEYSIYANLEYEGEFLNGERNGKGKEYSSHSLSKFEGEYFKGKRWNGKKLQYYMNGKIRAEFEYTKGKITNIKQYGENGEINELKEGKGIMKEYTYDGVFVFEGEYLNGKRNGKGKEYCEVFNNNILVFEGEYLNGKKWNGKGYDKKHNVIYEIKNGNGFIKEITYNEGKLKFEGEYKNGERNGKGKEYNHNRKVIYEGEYKNGERNGLGKEYDNEGELMYEGEYLNGKRNGKGKMEKEK